VNNGDLYNRSKVEYELADGLLAGAGVDVFSGKDGQFGVYKVNTQVWFRLKYSF
jgi:hypothetical protein